VIAKVGGDEAGHKVTVTDTEDVQMLYNTESPLVVKGSNFNPSGTKLKFANGLALNANYTIATIDDKVKLIHTHALASIHVLYVEIYMRMCVLYTRIHISHLSLLHSPPTCLNAHHSRSAPRPWLQN
jgi:hypothetical protein